MQMSFSYVARKPEKAKVCPIAAARATSGTFWASCVNPPLLPNIEMTPPGIYHTYPPVRLPETELLIIMSLGFTQETLVENEMLYTGNHTLTNGYILSKFQ